MLASQQVLHAVRQRLVDAGTSAGAAVYTDRFHPVAAFPAIKVLHAGEDFGADDSDIAWPARRAHELAIDVQAYVQASAGLDDAMADIAAEVLAALEAAALPLAPLPVALQAESLRYQAQQDGQAAAGVATVRFTARFGTVVDDPEAIA